MKFDLTIEHTIQKQIIHKLAYADSLRYSALKPDNTESNLFMYHLKQLIKLGFVEKNGMVYQLTPMGLAHVDKLSMKDFKHRVQAKIITILAVEHTDGRWLMLRRLHQPYIGKIGFPSGKVHYGEQFATAAARDLEEKTGITDIKLTLRGTCNFTFASGDDIVSNILGVVFYGKTDTKAGEKKGMGSESYWAAKPTDETDEFIPGYQMIHDALRKHDGLFFLEHTFEFRHLLQ